VRDQVHGDAFGAGTADLTDRGRRDQVEQSGGVTAVDDLRRASRLRLHRGGRLTACDQMKFPEYQSELRFRLAGAATNLIHRAPLQQEVPANVLPTLAGGFTAALTGVEVYQWRIGLGPIPDSETIAWAYACATTVTILDDKLGPGVFGQVVAAITDADDGNDDLSPA
jgi:hypothetical protein